MVASLEGRALLITGAGSGIGRATALLAASLGAVIAGIDIDEGGINTTVQEVRRHGGRIETRVADVADGTALTASIAALAADVGPFDDSHPNC